jgi:hypothetical protein
LNFDWEFKHIIIGLFESTEPIGQPLVKNIINLFQCYNLRNKIIAYVKIDKFNLNAMTITLKFIVSCEAVGLEESFQGTYFDLTFFKAYQYAKIDEKCAKASCVHKTYSIIFFAKVHYLLKNSIKGGKNATRHV